MSPFRLLNINLLKQGNFWTWKFLFLMWHCVAVWVAPDGLRAHSVIILRVKQAKKDKKTGLFDPEDEGKAVWSYKTSAATHEWHVVTSQKMWIFSNTTVRTSSLIEKHLAATLQKTDRSAKWYLLHCPQIKPTVMNVWQIYTGRVVIFPFSMYNRPGTSNPRVQIHNYMVYVNILLWCKCLNEVIVHPLHTLDDILWVIWRWINHLSHFFSVTVAVCSGNMYKSLSPTTRTQHN